MTVGLCSVHPGFLPVVPSVTASLFQKPGLCSATALVLCLLGRSCEPCLLLLRSRQEESQGSLKIAQNCLAPEMLLPPTMQ